MLVSREGHCLYELLARWHSGDLGADIAAVIGNHHTLGRSPRCSDAVRARPGAVRAGRQGGGVRARSAELVDALDPDAIVLARFMQVVPPELCRGLGGPADQHPPRLPAVVPRRPALPPGVHARRQDHRRDLPLRDGRAGRRADHRPGRDPRRPHATPPRTWPARGRDIEKTRAGQGLGYHLQDRVLLRRPAHGGVRLRARDRLRTAERALTGYGASVSCRAECPTADRRLARTGTRKTHNGPAGNGAARELRRIRRAANGRRTG